MNRQSGISLIEVLVAVLVLAIGLLGIAGLQTAALATNFSSYQSTQAAALSQSMAERMRANAAGVIAGNYSLTAGSAPGAASQNCWSPTAACTVADQAKWDMSVFYAEVTGSSVNNSATLTPNTAGTKASSIGILPSGAASIVCPANSVGSTCIITVYWDPNKNANSSGSNYYACDGSSGALSCYKLAFRP